MGKGPLPSKEPAQLPAAEIGEVGSDGGSNDLPEMAELSQDAGLAGEFVATGEVVQLDGGSGMDDPDGSTANQDSNGTSEPNDSGTTDSEMVNSVCTPVSGCEPQGAPSLKVPTPLRPFRGKYTGSVHAPSPAQTLRPVFEWSPVAASCGIVSYQFQLDDSCTLGELTDCAFDSPTLDSVSETSRFQPQADLPVSRVVPVGTPYSWRVRACDDSCRCSNWSDVAYLNVGRTRDDINGDGYADIAVNASNDSDAWLDVYFGSPQMNVNSDARIAHQLDNARFAGDLNADGFAEIVGIAPSQQPCGEGLTGQHVRVIWGSADPNQPNVSDLCSTAGTSSVFFRVGFSGDVNGDGFDDLAVARGLGNDNNFWVLAGAAQLAGVPLVDIEGRDESYSFTQGDHPFGAGGDLDGDGYADVVVTEFDGGNPLLVHLLKGSADSGSSFADTTTIEGCQNPGSVSTAGMLDGTPAAGIVCASAFSAVTGGDTFEVNTLLEAPGLLAASPPIDFDQDGTAEFFVASSESSPIIWEPGVSTDSTFATLQFGGKHPLACTWA